MEEPKEFYDDAMLVFDKLKADLAETYIKPIADFLLKILK